MNMSITKRNFLGYLSILTLVGGGLGALVLHYLEPGHYFRRLSVDTGVLLYIRCIFIFICLMPAGVMHRRRW